MPTAQFCSMSAVNYWRWALKNHQRLTHFLVKSLIRTAVLCSDLRLVSELRLCISCYCFPTLGKASPFVLICLWLYWTTFKTGSKPTTVLHSFKSFALSPVNPQLNLNTRAYCSRVCTQPSKPQYVSYAQATYSQVHNYLHTWYPNPRSYVCEPLLAMLVCFWFIKESTLLSLFSSGKFYTYTVAGPPPGPPYVQNSPQQRHSTLICYRPLHVCCRRAMCFRGDVPPRSCLNVICFSQPNSSSAPPIGMILPWCSEQFITPTIQQLNASTA